MQRSLRVSLFAVFALVAACGTDSRDPIIDDWGTSGYARIEGTVKTTEGVPVRGTSLFFICGPVSPDGFGWSPPTYTDSLGRFSFDIDAPGLLGIPESGVLSCRVSVPYDGPLVASVVHTVRFSKAADARPVTVVELIAP